MCSFHQIYRLCLTVSLRMPQEMHSFWRWEAETVWRYFCRRHVHSSSFSTNAVVELSTSKTLNHLSSSATIDERKVFFVCVCVHQNSTKTKDTLVEIETLPGRWWLKRRSVGAKQVGLFHSQFKSREEKRRKCRQAFRPVVVPTID